MFVLNNPRTRKAILFILFMLCRNMFTFLCNFCCWSNSYGVIVNNCNCIFMKTSLLIVIVQKCN